MSVTTRAYRAFVLSVVIVATALVTLFGTHLYDEIAGQRASDLKTANYNDGWTDGQADIADMLGHRMPTAGEQRQLIKDRPLAGAKCVLAWDAPVRSTYEIVCPSPANGRIVPAGCVNVPLADQQACVTLDYRNATTTTQPDGTKISTPDGTALIAECVSQYKGVELSSCLRQPAE